MEDTKWEYGLEMGGGDGVSSVASLKAVLERSREEAVAGEDKGKKKEKEQEKLTRRILGGY